MSAHLKVMVGIPTMSNRITVQVAGLLDLLRAACYDAESNFDFRASIKYGLVPVEYARNAIVGESLRSDCNKLWFIDEDMLPDSSVARLLASPYDITCAQMYRFDHPNPEKGTTVGLGLCAMHRRSDNFYQPIMPEPGMPMVMEVDAVGTGCTVIDRAVLEDRRLWHDNVYTTVKGETIDGNVDTGEGEYAPAIFRFVRGPNGVPIMGEDIDFCERAKALGYTIAVDLAARCGHFKQINIDEAGNLAAETVQRVVRGIKTEDGRVFKFAVQEEKGLDAPPMDKAVHAAACKSEAV